MVPQTLHAATLPIDTSKGVFSTLEDVGRQDAAIASNWPVLKDKFSTLSKTITENEKINTENRADYEAAIDDIIEIFEGLTD